MESSPASTNVARLFLSIDEAIEEGAVTKALRLILTNFGKFPDTAALRERVAQALAKRGRKREAVAILELVARHYANGGHPTRCLAAIKQMNALKPDATMLLDHFSALYAIRSPYLNAQARLGEVEDPTEELDLSGKEPQVGEQELFELAVDRAMQKRGMIAQPKALPALPLLSLLPTEALRRVLDFVEYEIFVESQPVVTREEMATDLVWTVTANLTMREGDETWRLPSGTLLGLNGFGRPRVPSEFTVSSSRGSEILRLSAGAIRKLDEEMGDFANRLATLRRHAMTERLVASHELFTLLDEEARVALVERFVGLHIKEEEYLIKQGSPSPGLFIILDGQVDVVRDDDGWEITIATLKPGEIFGEIGLVSDQPAVAGVTAASNGIMLFLSSDDFNEAASRHPPLAKFAANLASERLRDVDTTLSASDLVEVE